MGEGVRWDGGEVRCGDGEWEVARRGETGEGSGSGRERRGVRENEEGGGREERRGGRGGVEVVVVSVLLLVVVVGRCDCQNVNM